MKLSSYQQQLVIDARARLTEAAELLDHLAQEIRNGGEVAAYTVARQAEFSARLAERFIGDLDS